MTRPSRSQGRTTRVANAVRPSSCPLASRPSATARATTGRRTGSPYSSGRWTRRKTPSRAGSGGWKYQCVMPWPDRRASYIGFAPARRAARSRASNSIARWSLLAITSRSADIRSTSIASSWASESEACTISFWEASDTARSCTNRMSTAVAPAMRTRPRRRAAMSFRRIDTRAPVHLHRPRLQASVYHGGRGAGEVGPSVCGGCRRR
jgi:hypothetical protein